MGVPLEEMMARLPAARRRRVEARAAELVAEEMSLRDLRKAMGKTQVAVAHKLGLKQENVSRVEQRADILLSTLDSYLRAVGGRLRLMVEFKDRAPVQLSGFKTFDPVANARVQKNVAAKTIVRKRSRPPVKSETVEVRPPSRGRSRRVECAK